MKVSRRSFLGISAAALAGLIPAHTLAQEDAPELEQVTVSDGYTEIPERGDLLKYRGDDPVNDLRRNPADMEGVAVEVSGTILKRWVADEGKGFRSGYEDDVYRTVVWVTLSSLDKGVLLSNDDLSELEGSRTYRALVTFAGEYTLVANSTRYELPALQVISIEPGGAR